LGLRVKRVIRERKRGLGSFQIEAASALNESQRPFTQSGKVVSNAVSGKKRPATPSVQNQKILYEKNDEKNDEGDLSQKH
jgi:hypothetical protein